MDAESAGPVAGKRALTVCAYICGDTGKVTGDIEEELIEDLHEMMVAGATPDMAILVQLDKGSNGQCTRFILAEKSGYATLAGEEDIGPVNMGTTSTLVDFLDWCMATRPAENYALIVGSHGSGPKADDVYGVIRKSRITAAVVDRTSTTVAESAQVGAERAIAFDDGSRSFLSIPDLRRALEHGVGQAGKPFAVVVFDACYMASFEVLHELQGLADYVVASPEAVPGEGMPYTALLQVWRAWADWKEHPAKLGSYAVDAFRGAYEDTAETASLLAVDMARMGALSEAMDDLGAALLKAKKPLIDATLNGTEVTSDPDFMYLYEWLSRLISGKVPKSVREAAAAVMLLFWETETQPSILAASWARTGIADDVTVYFPFSVPGWYKDLAVAKTAWGEWVQQL